MILVAYLTFLKNNHSDDLARENARLYKSRDIPLLNFFTHLSDAEFVALTKVGLIKLIEDFEGGREYDELHASIKRWVDNTNPMISKEQVKIEDLINIYSAQKEALFHFVSFYTTESSVCVQIFKELEAYYSTAYLLTVDTFVQIHNEEVKASEKKYRLLAENSSDVITRQTADGIVTYISPSCKAVLGYEQEELQDKSLLGIVHPEDIDAATRNLMPADSETVETSEFRMKRKDGTYIWLEITAKRVLDQQTHQVLEVHSSARNITVRKMAQEQLKKNEELLRESQRIARIGSWEWDVRTNELNWTPEHYSLYGIDPAEGKITYEKAALRRHPDDAPVMNEILGQSVSAKTPFDFVHRLLIDGVTKVLNVKGEVIGENGQPARLRGTSQDITHISRMQQEMVKKNSQLEEAQSVAHLGSWEWDIAADTVIWSDEMYRIFGYAPSAVAVDFKFYLDHIFPDDSEFVEQHITACFKEGKSYSFENRIVTAQGDVKWLYATGQVAEKRGDSALVLSGTALDITKRKSMEIALDEKVKDLEKSNNDLQMFASIASHDLKEPLRKIRTNASILTENYASALDPKIKKYVERIEGSAARMERLIADVLSVSQIGKNKDDLEKTDLNAIVAHCLIDLEIQVKNKGVKIKVEKLPDNLLLNPEQMYQLFLNLISNSLKFSGDSEPFLTIKVTTGMPPFVSNPLAKKYYNITFTDNGIGFEQEYADKLFIMFQRLHEKEKYEGTGIGLAICKKIVENHQGYIRADGELGSGAVFTVSLPMPSR